MENFDLETGDLLSGLGEALTNSLKNCSLTPLLKQELKSKIQYNRLKRGEEEMKVDFENKPSYELRDEEIERQRRRREVNRLAALKFRRKKKNQVKILEEREKELKQENKRLLEELQQLRNLHNSQFVEAVKEIQSPQEVQNNVFVWMLIPETRKKLD